MQVKHFMQIKKPRLIFKIKIQWLKIRRKYFFVTRNNGLLYLNLFTMCLCNYTFSI